MRLPNTLLSGVTLTAAGSSGFTYDKLIAILNNLGDTFRAFGLTLATAVVVYYGFLMALSRGDAAKFTKAKEHLMIAALGAAIVFGIDTIIATVRYLADTLTS